VNTLGENFSTKLVHPGAAYPSIFFCHATHILTSVAPSATELPVYPPIVQRLALLMAWGYQQICQQGWGDSILWARACAGVVISMLFP